MGKLQGQTLPLHQQNNNDDGGVGSSRTFCPCSIGLSRIFNFKCIVVLVLSVVVFLSAVFWILPHRSHPSGFDAKEAIKRAATTQAYFRLEKPVSDIVPHIARLEYDILEEIAIPNMKISVLSVHAARVANQTNVIFGFLPDPVDSSSTPVSLSLLKSALLDLYLRDTNLTLTSSIFGQPSSFEVLKCPGGITMMPERLPLYDLPDILFNFTLHSSIDEIREHFIALKEQLIFGLRLRRDEHVFLQISNTVGSTKDPPVIVEASVSSGFRSPPPQRLQQLAQIVMGSVPTSNLGLDNSVFGKVKQVSLSSFLNRTIHTPPPTLPPVPTPAPAPNEPLWPSPSPSPAVSSSPSPAPLPNCHRFLRSHCGPARGKEPSSSPFPIAEPPSPPTNSGPPVSSSGIAASPSSLAPAYPPQMSSSISSSSSSFAPGFSYKELCLFWLFGLAVLHILG
ncbi:uncharacterized protein LOC132064603 [Lycium ferocissimum]|uniref:uncharacterized protein LOC132064603 n=1 Tax=Lycium ferocissimum TaxID=112874 RepID=UPI002814B954|nr:uncharacterized protein LOC132064603 [Lycium ferocissimum]